MNQLIHFQKALSELRTAISLHHTHIQKPKTATPDSQNKMMAMMKAALIHFKQLRKNMER